MMLPVRIEGAMTPPIGAPKDWSEEQHGHCSALFIRLDDIDGLRFMRSAWQPTPGELVDLNAGASVILGVSGQGHPVVNMAVGPVPSEAETPPAARYTLTEEARADGSTWCMIRARFGDHAFPAGIELSNPNKPDTPVITMADAASRLIAAVEIHARAEGWIE